MSACKIRVRDGFWVMLAALWCVDEDGLLPVFLFAALVHETGHAAVLALSGGRLRRLTLTACGAVMQAALPADRYARAAVSLAGPLAGFLLTLAAHSLGAYRLAGASALLSLFNLIPLPPLDGGMALRYLADGRFPCLRACLAAGSGAFLLLIGVLLWLNGGGIWLLSAGAGACIAAVRTRKQRKLCAD